MIIDIKNKPLLLKSLLDPNVYHSI